jgi:hypothetical protein
VILYDTVEAVMFAEKTIIDAKYAETNRVKFRRLKGQWLNEIAGVSDLDEIVENENYQEIISMGYDVVQFIIDDLKRSPKPWFYALREITGDSPIPANAAGNLQQMTDAWLSWAKKNRIKDVVG